MRSLLSQKSAQHGVAPAMVQRPLAHMQRTCGLTTRQSGPALQQLGQLQHTAPMNMTASRSDVACRAIPTAAVAETLATPPLDLPPRTFIWRGHKVKYVTAGCGQPIVLVHGFGASSGHYKKNIAVLAKNYKVYAIDLLGFGGSEKPQLDYSMDLWRDQILDFMAEFVQVPAVVVGNSIGSLAVMMAAAQSPGAVKGLVLLNCVGAMNNKGIINDWRIILVYPILLLIDTLLKSPLAAWLFDTYRTKENITGILKKVYRNQDAVDEALVELLYRPSCDEGALGVFVSVLTGAPGPRPWDVITQVASPMLVLWGDKDPFTPADGPVGKYFKELPATRAGTKFEFLEDVGHCPHDDRPEEVHKHMLPWLSELYSSNDAACETAPARA